jgi:repressor LexA
LVELSPRQAQIVEFIQCVVDQRGVAPSYREIGAALEIRSTNAVSDHIKALIRKGYVEQVGGRGRPRSLRLTTKATGRIEESRVVLMPVLGRIAAGQPLLAAENLEDTIAVDAGMLPSGGKIFALVVRGDSMIEDGIHEGDYLFVRQTPTVSEGDIAVVMLEDEATVKRFFREGDRIRLQPGNSSMAPIYVDPQMTQVTVLGKAVGVYRRIQ